MRRKRRPPEPLACLTAELAPIILRWITGFERDHPKRAKVERGRYGDRSPLQYSAKRWLEVESGVPYRLLMVVLTEKSLTVSLSVADDLLTAIGECDRIGCDVAIVSNPRWPKERVVKELELRGVDTGLQFWAWAGQAA